MKHLAIMRNPWMKYLINGTKTIESRISQRKIIPWRKVVVGDWIYFRLAGDSMVNHRAQVKQVKYYSGFQIFDKLREYQHEIGIDENYIQSKQKCQYLTLIWLSKVEELGINCFPFVKKDQRAWVLIEEAKI